MTYDPNEPRDAHGKWEHGSGSGHYDKLTVNTILNGPQLAKAGSRRNSDIAKELNARGQAALKELGVPSGVINSPEGKSVSDPKENNILSSAIASEIENELSRGEEKHAADWYTTKMKDTMEVATKMHPEMANNPGAKFAISGCIFVATSMVSFI